MAHYCNVCQTSVTFDIEAAWPRDQTVCPRCGSIVRHRALLYVLQAFYPDMSGLTIHQSSPAPSAFDQFLSQHPGYSYSHYFPDIPVGEKHSSGVLCVDLARIPMPDNSVDIFMTLDVFEHIFEFDKSIQEIYRVLKPGGRYIMTVPLENMERSTEKACYLNEEGHPVHIPTQKSADKGVTLEYHGNPIDGSGSVVTYYYGYDILDMIKSTSSFIPSIFFKDGGLPQYGILGYFKEVIVCFKPTP